jgi:hypothetical protein
VVSVVGGSLCVVLVQANIGVAEGSLVSQAPVALFVYNRPEHTRQTVAALAANMLANKTPLHVFSDAPRNAAARRSVEEVRSYIRTITGFKFLTIIERATNFGLACSIIDGVTSLCEKHGRVIVLEDDLVVAPHFLKYMNDALDFYEHEQRVISIAGYRYPIDHDSESSTFLLKGTNCWGWATWKRGWNLFDADGGHLLAQLQERGLTREFDMNGAYGYTRMLKNQVRGDNDSWAVRWHASAFLKDRLTLLPHKSLVKNIGLDGSGVHCAGMTWNPFNVELCSEPVTVKQIPIEVDIRMANSLEVFYRAARRITRWNAIKRPWQTFKRRLFCF